MMKLNNEVNKVHVYNLRESQLRTQGTCMCVVAFYIFNNNNNRNKVRERERQNERL